MHFRDNVNLIDPSPDSAAQKSEVGSSTEDSKTGRTRSHVWRSLVLDFLVIVVPTVACLTVSTFSASQMQQFTTRGGTCILSSASKWKKCDSEVVTRIVMSWAACDAAGFSRLVVHHLGCCVRTTVCGTQFSKVSIIRASCLSYVAFWFTIALFGSDAMKCNLNLFEGCSHHPQLERLWRKVKIHRERLIFLPIDL